MTTYVIASGYFDPIHVGHIEYFRLSKALGDKLIVIVNTDKQALKKKGYVFMPEGERIEIIRSIGIVDNVILSIDTDESVSRTLSFLSTFCPGDKLIFAKGGDRHAEEIPENKTCKKYNIEIVDGLGNKIQSSSELTKLAGALWRSK